MNKDFNVYKWRREHLVENEEPTVTALLNAFKTKTDRGAFKSGNDNEGYIETRDRLIKPGFEKQVEEIFKEQGYTLERSEEIEGEPGERLDMIRYYYKKA